MNSESSSSLSGTMLDGKGGFAVQRGQMAMCSPRGMLFSLGDGFAGTEHTFRTLYGQTTHRNVRGRVRASRKMKSGEVVHPVS